MVPTHEPQVIPVTPMMHLRVVTSGLRVSSVVLRVRSGLRPPELEFANSEETKTTMVKAEKKKRSGGGRRKEEEEKNPGLSPLVEGRKLASSPAGLGLDPATSPNA